MAPTWTSVRNKVTALLLSKKKRSSQQLGAAIRHATAGRYNKDQYKTAWKHYCRIMKVDPREPASEICVTVETIYVYCATRVYLEKMAPHTIGDVLSHLKSAATRFHNVSWSTDIDRDRQHIIEVFHKSQPVDVSKLRRANPLTQKALKHAIKTIGIRTPGARIKCGMFMMAYLACLRANEVLPVKRIDVDIDKLSLLLFYIKDAKTRGVVAKDILDLPTLPCYRELLRHIVADRPANVSARSPLFPFVSKSGEVQYGVEWKKHTWLRMFRDTMASFDSDMDPQRWTPHSARSGLVTDLLLSGASKHNVRIMGWKFNSEVPFTVYDRRAWLTGKDAVG
jgi:integrase